MIFILARSIRVPPIQDWWPKDGNLAAHEVVLTVLTMSTAALVVYTLATFCMERLRRIWRIFPLGVYVCFLVHLDSFDPAKFIGPAIYSRPIAAGAALLFLVVLICKCAILLVGDYRSAKRLRDIRNSICYACGYDLRGSPRECLECGASPHDVIGPFGSNSA